MSRTHRIGHLADLHLTAGRRLEEQRRVLLDVVRAGRRLGVDAWILAGDLYGHTVPHRSSPEERHVLCEVLSEMLVSSEVLIVAGNHDHEVDLDGLRYLRNGWREVHVSLRPSTYLLGCDPDVVDSGVVVRTVPYPWKRWLVAGDSATSVEAARLHTGAALERILLGIQGEIAEDRRNHPEVPQLVAAHCHVAGGTAGAGVVLAGQEVEVSAAALDALGADYVALGHLHEAQEISTESRAWYSGSPWHTAHSTSEPTPRTWSLVEIGEGARCDVFGVVDYPASVGRLPCRVAQFATGARELRTVTYRWAPDETGRLWSTLPSAAELQACRGAEVRVRVVTTSALASTCPWSSPVADVLASGAVDVVEDRVIEPVHRRRSVDLPATASLAELIAAYWSQVATPPTEEEQRRALEQLELLQTLGDDEISHTLPEAP